jgi:DNA-binding XRE family transcriptional regulator
MSIIFRDRAQPVQKIKTRQVDLLADRIGISRATLQKIENGEMTCAIGLVFEAATLVDINLFEQDRVPLAVRIEHTNDKIALLPQRIKTITKVVDDDF